MRFSRQKALSQRAYIIIIRKHQGGWLASAPSPRGFLTSASSKQQRRKIHHTPTHGLVGSRSLIPSRDGRDKRHSAGLQKAERSCHTAAGRNASPSCSRDECSTRFSALQELKALLCLYNSGGILAPLTSLPILGALTSKHELLLLLIAFSHFFFLKNKQTEKKKKPLCQILFKTFLSQFGCIRVTQHRKCQLETSLYGKLLDSHTIISLQTLEISALQKKLLEQQQSGSHVRRASASPYYRLEAIKQN